MKNGTTVLKDTEPPPLEVLTQVRKLLDRNALEGTRLLEKMAFKVSSTPDISDMYASFTDEKNKVQVVLFCFLLTWFCFTSPCPQR